MFEIFDIFLSYLKMGSAVSIHINQLGLLSELDWNMDFAPARYRYF